MTTKKQNIFRGIFETLKSWPAIIADNWHLHALALPLAFLINMYGSYLQGKKLNLFTNFFYTFYNMDMTDRFIHQFFAGLFLAISWEVLQALYQWLIKGHKMSSPKQTIAHARDIIVTTILYYVGAIIGILVFPSL